MKMHKNTAYVYKWTHIPSYKWYIGSRTAKNAHPDDGYICSSKQVKPLILANLTEWRREIIAIGDPESMYELESEILDCLDAMNDPRSFNLHNNNRKCNMIGRKHTKETKLKMAIASKGKKKGKPISNEQKRKQSEKMKGKMAGEKNPMYGKIPYNFGKKTNNPSWNRGLKNPNNIEKNIKIHICPHCKKEGKGPSMKRWHFDNCKLREVK